MPSSKMVSLIEMQANQSGTVMNIDGGHGMTDRLNTLSIIPGKRITKISSMVMRGPVTIEVDRTQIALGYGMARRIFVLLES